MPSPRAVLHDIIEKKLDPSLAYSNYGASGKLRAKLTQSESVSDMIDRICETVIVEEKIEEPLTEVIEEPLAEVETKQVAVEIGGESKKKKFGRKI